MAVTLGRDGGAPTGGNGATGIINVTWNQEVTAIDVTHRGLINASGISFKAATGGFVTRTAERLDPNNYQFRQIMKALFD